MVLSGTILMVTIMATIRMAHKVIGFQMIPTDGKIQTEMVTQMKMTYSLMISHSGTIPMAMVMVII